MLFPLLVALTIVGVLKFLLLLAILCLLIVGVKYILGLMGVTLPQPIWVVLGLILFLLICLWFFGGAGSLGIS